MEDVGIYMILNSYYYNKDGRNCKENQYVVTGWALELWKSETEHDRIRNVRNVKVSKGENNNHV